MDELTKKIYEETLPDIIKQGEEDLAQNNALLKAQDLPIKTEEELDNERKKESSSMSDSQRD